MNELILVLDFGAQYKELIARAVRRCNVYSEIKSGHITAQKVKELNPIGIILTGGPKSVYGENTVKFDTEIFELGIPIMGICFGMQLLCHLHGGIVESCEITESGKTTSYLNTNSKLFSDNISENEIVLMSHNDQVTKLPENFVNIGSTDNCLNAAFEYPEKKLYGVQFHPETEHTVNGFHVIKNFLYNICNASGDYNIDNYLEKQIEIVRQKVGEERIILALSGGVDSAVCAALLSKAVPNQLICIFVDHGFMRLNEGEEMEEAFKDFDLKLLRVNAHDRFLAKIQGVTEPEKKRKIIGKEFIEVFKDESEKLGNVKFLAQGTIYPDVIESGSEDTATIKSHHNVGGLPKDIPFEEIIEPLSGLFKDEVRVLGRKLGLKGDIVDKQPFPGPGLCVRIIGEVTKEKLNILKAADKILTDELEKSRDRPEQYFAVFTDIKTVGVKGDSRTYDYVIAVRAVTTSDFMTCDYAKIPHETLEIISSRIVNEVKSVNRVVYDITSKPPATIEWE